MKKEMINDHSDFKKFRVTDNFNENVMHEFMSWLRFVEFDENITLLIDYQARASTQAKPEDSDSDDGHDDPNRGFKAKDLPPLSIRNEQKVLLRMKLEATKLLSGYPQTYEEDLEILENNKDLTFNTRNAVLMRSGEKKILKHVIDTADAVSQYFTMDQNEVRKALKNSSLKEDQKNYVKRVVLLLLKDKE